MKHLNLLLEDQSVENARTYRWDQPPNSFSLGLSKQRTAAAQQHAQKPGQLGVSWQQQQVADSHVPNEELATKVGNKRTPSGNFFSTVNSALVEKQPPPNYYAAEDLTVTAVAALAASRGRGRQPDYASSAGYGTSHSAEGYDQAPSPTGSGPDGPAVYKFSSSAREPTMGLHQAAMSRSTSQRAAPWTMPWETGDRATGRKMAEMVRSKRTPSGNFSVLALAKANK